MKQNGLSGAEEDSASPRPVSLTSEIFKSFLDLNRTSRKYSALVDSYLNLKRNSSN